MRRDPSQQVTKLRHFDRSSTKRLFEEPLVSVCARVRVPEGKPPRSFPSRYQRALPPIVR